MNNGSWSCSTPVDTMLTSSVPSSMKRSTCSGRSVGMPAGTVLVTSSTCSVKSPDGVIMIPTVDSCFSSSRSGTPCSCTGITRVWLCCDHDVRNVHYSLGGNCQKSDMCSSLLQAESTVELRYKLRWRDYKVNCNFAAKSRTFHCGKALNRDQENGRRSYELLEIETDHNFVQRFSRINFTKIYQLSSTKSIIFTIRDVSSVL